MAQPRALIQNSRRPAVIVVGQLPVQLIGVQQRLRLGQIPLVKAFAQRPCLALPQLRQQRVHRLRLGHAVAGVFQQLIRLPPVFPGRQIPGQGQSFLAVFPACLQHPLALLGEQAVLGMALVGAVDDVQGVPVAVLLQRVTHPVGGIRERQQ